MGRNARMRQPGRARHRLASAAIAVWVPLLACASASAETWTNVVGRTTEAEFVECVGRTVVLRKADGTRMTVPLSSLCAADRRRVAVLTQSTADTEQRTPSHTAAGDAEQRASALHAAGRISDGDLARVLQALRTNELDTSCDPIQPAKSRQ